MVLPVSRCSGITDLVWVSKEEKGDIKGNGAEGSLGNAKGLQFEKSSRWDCQPATGTDSKTSPRGERMMASGALAGLFIKPVCVSDGGCFEGKEHGSAINHAVKPPAGPDSWSFLPCRCAVASILHPRRLLPWKSPVTLNRLSPHKLSFLDLYSRTRVCTGDQN